MAMKSVSWNCACIRPLLANLVTYSTANYSLKNLVIGNGGSTLFMYTFMHGGCTFLPYIYGVTFMNSSKIECSCLKFHESMCFYQNFNIAITFLYKFNFMDPNNEIHENLVTWKNPVYGTACMLHCFTNFNAWIWIAGKYAWYI